MSVSYWGKVIVGCPLKDLYRYDIKEVDATRYHEKTGKPYTIKVKQLFGIFGNKELPPVERGGNQYCEEYYQNFDFLEKPLEVFIPFGSEDPTNVFNHGLVGIEICSGDRDNEVDKGISMPGIKNAMDLVKKALKKYDWEGMPKLFCQLDGG